MDDFKLNQVLGIWKKKSSRLRCMVRVFEHSYVSTFIEMRQNVCSRHNFITFESAIASDNVGSVSAWNLPEFN
jgi:hypothetical protein